jgi:hypothetical protein
MPLKKTHYLHLRRVFEPTTIKLVIVAESPPISGKYFYDSDGKINEPLFKALMRQIGIEPRTKIDGLEAFRERDWVLVDATYEPVNARHNRQRNDTIERDYPELCEGLKKLLTAQWNTIPLLLVKANVCDLLEPKLTRDGFNVMNKGRRVYFPSHGRQKDFARQFSEVIGKGVPD